MKSQLFAFLFGAALAGAGVWTWFRHDDDDGKKKEEEHHEESRVEHSKDGRVLLELDDETREKIGLKSAPLAEAELAPQVRAVGRVLDPEPLGALVGEIAAARIAVDSSVKEFERLRGLNAAGQNASARALESAEAEAKKSRLAVEALERRLLGTWGPAIAGRMDLAQLSHELAARKVALVRLDVPPDEGDSSRFTKAAVLLPGNEDAPLDVVLLGTASDADPLMRGPGFLALLSRSAPPIGTVFAAWLSDSSAPRKGVIIPREAVIRHEGRMFAYLGIEGAKLERREIEAAQPTSAGWFVVGGFSAGFKVVTQGAQQLLSEELKSSFGEEP
jgi:hypothetical protein